MKTVVKGNTDWLESEEREAPKEILESHKEPSHTTSGRGPVVPSFTGKQAPNGPVSGFRGSQKDNGHPPNGGPGGSARRFRPAAPPRPPGAAHLRSAPGPAAARGRALAARCGPATARGHAPLRPARLCSPGPPHSPPPSPARSQAPRANAARREKGGTGVSRQSRLYWAPGSPRARRPLPRAAPGPLAGRDPARGRPRPPLQAPSPAAPGTAHRSPAPEAAAAAATPRSRVRPGPGAADFAALAPRRAGAARVAAAAVAR